MFCFCAKVSLGANFLPSCCPWLPVSLSFFIFYFQHIYIYIFIHFWKQRRWGRHDEKMIFICCYENLFVFNQPLSLSSSLPLTSLSHAYHSSNLLIIYPSYWEACVFKVALSLWKSLKGRGEGIAYITNTQIWSLPPCTSFFFPFFFLISLLFPSEWTQKSSFSFLCHDENMLWDQTWFE